MAGVGLGWRSPLAAGLLSQPSLVDFVEVVAESCIGHKAARREALALAEVWPVLPHGVKLSLGSAEGIDVERALRLGRLTRELGAPLVTEHVAFVRAAGREIGHLTPLPFTRAALTVVERNVARARSYLPEVPLALENVACTFQWPEAEMDEGDFYAEVVRRTGCALLLDVSNLFANAVNGGRDPSELVRRFPLDAVAMIHVAGGVWREGFYFDDHAHAVNERIFSLLGEVLERTGPVPILIERDAAFPAFSDLAGEVTRCRAALSRAAPRDVVPAREPTLEGRDDPATLATQQREMAELLTTTARPTEHDAARYGPGAITRSRAILERKRLEEALSLLPLLGRHADVLAPLAEAALRSSERPTKLAAFGDAWRIAERAHADPRLAALASRELLLLRSRFVRESDGVLRARRAPFVGDARVGDRRIFAVKGFGSGAKVRLIERQGRP